MEEIFPQLFNVHGVKDVRQAEIHTAETPVPEPSAAEFELAIDKLKSHKSPVIDQILAELIKAGGRTICLEIHKLITSIWKKEKGDLLADSHSIGSRWRKYFPSYSTCMGLRTLGRQKYTQQRHQYLSQVPLSFSWLAIS